MKELIKKHILEHSATLKSIFELEGSIEKVANIFIHCLENDGRIFGVVMVEVLQIVNI